MGRELRQDFEEYVEKLTTSIFKEVMLEKMDSLVADMKHETALIDKVRGDIQTSFTEGNGNLVEIAKMMASKEDMSDNTKALNDSMIQIKDAIDYMRDKYKAQLEQTIEKQFETLEAGLLHTVEAECRKLVQEAFLENLDEEKTRQEDFLTSFSKLMLSEEIYNENTKALHESTRQIKNAVNYINGEYETQLEKSVKEQCRYVENEIRNVLATECRQRIGEIFSEYLKMEKVQLDDFIKRQKDEYSIQSIKDSQSAFLEEQKDHQNNVRQTVSTFASLIKIQSVFYKEQKKNYENLIEEENKRARQLKDLTEDRAQLGVQFNKFVEGQEQLNKQLSLLNSKVREQHINLEDLIERESILEEEVKSFSGEQAVLYDRIRGMEHQLTNRDRSDKKKETLWNVSVVGIGSANLIVLLCQSFGFGKTLLCLLVAVLPISIVIWKSLVHKSM